MSSENLINNLYQELNNTSDPMQRTNLIRSISELESMRDKKYFEENPEKLLALQRTIKHFADRAQDSVEGLKEENINEFNLAKSFLELPVTKRFYVARKLDLLSEDEAKNYTKIEEVSCQALIRAKERKQLVELWNLVFVERNHQY